MQGIDNEIRYLSTYPWLPVDDSFVIGGDLHKLLTVLHEICNKKLGDITIMTDNITVSGGVSIPKKNIDIESICIKNKGLNLSVNVKPEIDIFQSANKHGDKIYKYIINVDKMITQLGSVLNDIFNTPIEQSKYQQYILKN